MSDLLAPVLPIPAAIESKYTGPVDENGIPVHYSEATLWVVMTGIVTVLSLLMYGSLAILAS